MHIRQIKKDTFKLFGCRNAYEQTFFQSYESLADAKSNVKSVIFKPLIDGYLALESLLKGLAFTTLGLANLAIGAGTLSKVDLKEGSQTFSIGVASFFKTIYYTASAITDAMDSMLRIFTHSLGTIGLGFSKAASAIGAQFESSPSSPRPSPAQI